MLVVKRAKSLHLNCVAERHVVAAVFAVKKQPQRVHMGTLEEITIHAVIEFGVPYLSVVTKVAVRILDVTEDEV